jgi:hypothetical protein
MSIGISLSLPNHAFPRFAAPKRPEVWKFVRVRKCKKRFFCIMFLGPNGPAFNSRAP